MTAIQITSTTPGGPGLKRLRKSPQAAAVRAAVATDQKAARESARAKAATHAAKPNGKRSQRSPSRSAPVAGKAKPTGKAAATTIPRLSKPDPYRAGTVLSKMLALVKDGQTPGELAAALRKAGVKGSVSGFLSNARGKKLVE